MAAYDNRRNGRFTMTAEDLLRDGNLNEALKALQNQIRSRPEDARLRTFLFQLLSILGQWQRAFDQLNVLDKLDPGTWAMARIYRDAIQCEALRSEIFAGRQQPLIFGEPPRWMAGLVESLRLTATGQYPQAVSLRGQAFETAQASPGVIDDKPFEWIADADSRLGPVLELILNGHYYWVPFEQIRAIEMQPPADLQDFVWVPAQLTWVNGGQAMGLIPARYPDSESAQDSTIQLARKTEWEELADGVYRGLGQRMLATDLDDYPLLDVRNIEIG